LQKVITERREKSEMMMRRDWVKSSTANQLSRSRAT